MIGRAAIVTAPSIEPERCKGCGLCVEFCPFGRLRLSDSLNPSGYHAVETISPGSGDRVVEQMRSNFGFWCPRCRYCELICPEGAMRVCSNGGASDDPRGGRR